MTSIYMTHKYLFWIWMFCACDMKTSRDTRIKIIREEDASKGCKCPITEKLNDNDIILGNHFILILFSYPQLSNQVLIRNIWWKCLFSVFNIFCLQYSKSKLPKIFFLGFTFVQTRDLFLHKYLNDEESFLALIKMLFWFFIEAKLISLFMVH